MIKTLVVFSKNVLYSGKYGTTYGHFLHFELQVRNDLLIASFIDGILTEPQLQRMWKEVQIAIFSNTGDSGSNIFIRIRNLNKQWRETV